jgi:hypothetical protein
MEAGICYFMNDQIHEWLVDHQIPYRFGYLYEFDNIHEWSVQYVDLQLWWIEFEVKEHAMLFKLTWL